jgi:hypothetical protein
MTRKGGGRVVDNQPLTTRLDWLVATTNPTEHLKIGCQSNLNTYRLVGWLWGCLVGWWGGGDTGDGGVNEIIHFTRILRTNFIYNTPKPPPDDSVIRSIMLLYWHEAAVVA